MSEILKFYDMNATNPNGVSLDDIARYHSNDIWLESNHSYIQWIFPLKEESKAVPGSPVLTDNDIYFMKSSNSIKFKMMKMFKMMLYFYGFYTEVCADGFKDIVPSDWFDTRKKSWMTPGNHNFLRITRILKSMTLVGLVTPAKLFLLALLKSSNEHVTSETKRYWIEACNMEDTINALHQ